MVSNSCAIEVSHVTKTFGNNVALKDFSVNIEAGGMLGLVGPDGAGKTTLIRLLVGLLLPDLGEVTVNGFNTRDAANSIHEIIGYMPQKFGLYDDLTVYENLSLYADLRHVTGETRIEQCRHLLDFTQLDPFQSRLAGNLSGGMKQKLGLACTLIGAPKLLFLDEPSVGVDPLSRKELWSMVQGLLTGGMTVIWSTAYLNEAQQCDSVVLLNEGESLYSGPTDTFKERVRGRTWQVGNIPHSRRRKLLMHLLTQKPIVDGLISGDGLHLVLGDEFVQEDIEAIVEPIRASYNRVEPSFEDAFIDMIYRAPFSHSALAAQIHPKDQNIGSVIKVDKLTKKFGDFVAVDTVSFDIQRGEIFGLLGPNGAGKSTIFKMMCGLLQPSSGSAFVTGLDLKTATSRARSRIGYMAQHFSLYGALSVRENLKFFAGLYGLSRKNVSRQVDLMTEVFDLQKYLKSEADLLPLGFKQRLSLACAVMHEPDVLFLDEPTSGVDPLTRREFWNHINGMVEKGVTVMVTTHFMDEAEYCDRIGLIFNGKSIATGTPAELKKIASPTGKEMSLEDAFIELVKQNRGVIKSQEAD